MKNANEQTKTKKGASKKYQYTFYKIILKDNTKEISNDNIKDLKLITFFDSMEQVSDYLNYNLKYLSTFKTIKNRYKIVNDIIIYKDDIEELEGVN